MKKKELKDLDRHIELWEKVQLFTNKKINKNVLLKKVCICTKQERSF